MTRRLFLGHCAAIAASSRHLFAASRSPLGAASRGITIRSLRLVTGVPLAQMETFYGGLLGFHTRIQEGALVVEGPAWSVTFEHALGVAAHYHFAFNIPENQVVEAHDWCRQRVELITPPAFLRDRRLPREVVSFRHWNAHSVFFWDPAGSAVEFIARHTLTNSRTRPFGVDSAERISEIGLVVEDVPSSAAELRTALDLDTYIRASRGFEPLGNESGLLLIMRAGEPMAFGRGRARQPYPTSVRMTGRSDGGELTLPGYPYSLLASGSSYESADDRW